MKIIEIECVIEKDFIDQETNEVIDKTPEEIAIEKQGFIDEKKNKIQTEIDAYIADIERHKTQGGRGPRGTFQAIEIVKKHNGQFKVVFKE